MFVHYSIHSCKTLPVHRDGLASRVELYPSGWFCGILHHSNVACGNVERVTKPVAYKNTRQSEHMVVSKYLDTDVTLNML